MLAIQKARFAVALCIGICGSLFGLYLAADNLFNLQKPAIAALAAVASLLLMTVCVQASRRGRVSLQGKVVYLAAMGLGLVFSSWVNGLVRCGKMDPTEYKSSCSLCCCFRLVEG